MKLSEIQISIAQLDNYGPWTVSPEPKPEAYLQMLQTRLFADLEGKFSYRNGLAFISRFDNNVIVSNGLSKEDHEDIQKEIRKDYPVTVSFGIGHAQNPIEAQKLASEALQGTGSSQSEERKEIISGETLDFPEDSLVQIAHIDVDDFTKFTDGEPIYETHNMIQKVNLSLSEHLKPLNGMVFFTGGDNFMAPTNTLEPEEILKVLDDVEEDVGMRLKAGIGRSKNAVDAAYFASEGLHKIRDGSSEEKVVLMEE